MTLPETKFQGGEGRSELKRNWKVGHRDCCLEKFEWERKKLDWIWELKDTVFFLAWEKRECVINRGENAREEVKWREAMCRETCLWAEGRAWRTSKEDGIHDPRACTVEGQHGQSRDLRFQWRRRQGYSSGPERADKGVSTWFVKKVRSGCWGRQKRK